MYAEVSSKDIYYNMVNEALEDKFNVNDETNNEIGGRDVITEEFNV